MGKYVSNKVLLLLFSLLMGANQGFAESNEKAINEIYLNTIARHDYHFSENQIILIDNIAHQCPYTGGKGVYKARSLYALLYPLEVYDDKAACTAQNVNWRKGNIKTEIESFVKMYPNPTNDCVMFDFSTQSNDNREINLYDMMGRKAVSDIVEGKDLHAKLNIRHLAKGIYEVRITLGNENHYFGKLIIE